MTSIIPSRVLKFDRFFLDTHLICFRTFYGNRKGVNKKPTIGGTERIHLVDAEAIKFTVDSISSDWSKEKAVVIDTSPGPGLLLESLLRAGAPKVRGFLHGSSPYRSVLQGLKEKYCDRVELCDFDFTNFRSNFDSTIGVEQIKNVLDSALEAQPSHWIDDPPIKLIVPLAPSTEKKVLRRLIVELTLLGGIFAPGRSQIFAFISDKEYGFMKVRSDVKPAHNQASHILYKTFFQISHLKTFNWDCLHPTVNIQKSKSDVAPNVHLVSLIPKLELPDIIPMKDWPDYFYFVKQTMARKKNRIILFMEKLVPDCGLKLIKAGITVHKTFGELDSEEFIKLFTEIKSWPEFEMSNLANVTKEYLSSNDHYILQEEFINKR